MREIWSTGDVHSTNGGEINYLIQGDSRNLPPDLK